MSLRSTGRYALSTLLILVLLAGSSRHCHAEFPECPPWQDYMPELKYLSSGFWVQPRPVSPFFNGAYVEENWESYQGDEALYVGANGVYDNTTGFYNGELLVYQYYFYYPKNQWGVLPQLCLGGHETLEGFDHEHDWEWISVALVPIASSYVPFAVTISNHDDDNWTGETRYYPGTGMSSTIQVVDDTHPVIYIGDPGNAFSFAGASNTTISWSTLASAGDVAFETRSWKSCDAQGNETENSTIAYGIDDVLVSKCECKFPRDMPQKRPHCFDDPYSEQQFSGLEPSAYPNMACSPPAFGGTWSELRYMWGPVAKMHVSYGEWPLWNHRPQGVFTGAAGQRVLWSRWAPNLTGYQVALRSGQDEELLEQQADSEAVIVGVGGAMATFGVRGLVDGQEKFHVSGSEARLLGVAASGIEKPIELLRTLRAYGTLDVNHLVGVTEDGWLVAYDIANLESPALIEAYDLRDWDLWEDYSSAPRALAAEWMLFGYQDRLVIALSCPGRGVAILEGTDLTNISLDALVPIDAGDIALLPQPRGLVAACGEQGVKLFGLSWNMHLYATQRAVFLPEDFPGGQAATLGKLSTASVAASFVQAVSPFDAYLYQLTCSSTDVTQGWRIGTPPEWPYEDDPVWRLDDIDIDQQLGVLHGVGSAYFAHLDMTSTPPEYVGLQRNGLFKGALAVGPGKRSLCLPGGHFLKLGSTPVLYGSEIRFWGGLELCKYEPYRSSGPIRYVGGVAEDGFRDIDHPDLSARAFDRFVRDARTYVAVTYSNQIPVEPFGREHLLAFYRVTDDIATVSADGNEGLDGVGTAGLSWNRRPYANPARDAVRFSVEVPQPMRVRAEVFDVGGRRVRSILNGRVEPGVREFIWDRSDESGRRVTSGVYFLRIGGPSVELKSQLVILR